MQQTTKRRWVFQAATLLLLTLILASCGGARVPPDPSEPTPTTPEVGPQVGFRAPEIIGRDVITKQPVVLSSLVGQVVVLNFWAIWCKPCEDEMPELETFQNQNAENVRVIAVGTDARETSEKMAEFARRLNLTFSILDDQGTGAERYRIIGLPTTFFIDQTGIIRTKHQGQLNYAMIERMVADAEKKGRN